MRALAAIAIVLAGCTAQPAPPRAPSVEFVPDAGGLGVAPSGLRMDFGRSPRGMIPALDRELGPHRELTLAGCPAGVVRQLAWGGLVLSFSNERFIGWRDGDRAAGSVCV